MTGEIVTNADTLDYDVIVVGAGPVGLTLANLLGKYGTRTAIVERNAETVQMPRAVSIDDEALRTLQVCRLDEPVLADAVSGYGSHYKAPGGVCFAKVEPTSREYGFEKRNAFHQPQMEAALREGLARWPTVDVLFAHDMLGFTQDERAVDVEIRPDGGPPRRITARYLVGTDGAHSAIRSAIGATMTGESYEERWLIVDIARTQNRFRHTEVFCDPERPCISLPGPNGTRRFEMMIFRHEDEDALAAPENVLKMLRDHGEHDPDIRRIQPYTFHALIADKWQEGRVFLAGDAAHLTPPFAGQGLNSGMRDVFNLGWKLAWASAGRLPASVLSSYRQERPDHARELIDMAVTLGRIMMPRTRLRARMTQWTFQLLSLVPAIKSYIAELRYRPRAKFAAGFLLPDHLPSKQTLVGRMMPQPIVERQDRAHVRLDDLLGPGFALVVHAVDPLEALRHPVMKELGARGVTVIGLTPQRYNPVSGPLCVRDTSGNPELDPYMERCLLVRPDRIVAASLPIGALATLPVQLAALLPDRAPLPSKSSRRALSEGRVQNGPRL